MILKKSSPYLIAFLGFLMSTFGFLGSQLYLPSLPSMGAVFDASDTTVQMTMTVFYFSFAFCQLFYGPLSDKYGRKPVLIAGFIMSLTGTLGCALSESIEFFLFCRALQGAGLGASNSLVRSIFRDTFKDDKLAKIWSYVMAAVTLAPGIAPALGGYLQQTFGWRTAFFFALAYLAIGAALTLLVLPETNDNKNERAFHPLEILKNYWDVLRRKKFLGHVLCSALGMGGITAYGVATPFIYQNIIGLTPFENGQLAIFTALSVMVGSFMNGLLVEKFGPKKMLRIALCMMLLGGIGVVGTGFMELYTTIAVLLPSLLFFLGSGIIFPIAAAQAFVGLEKKAGSGSSMYGFMRTLMSFVTTTLIAYLPETSQIFFGGLFVVISLTGIGIYFLILREKNA